MMYLNDAPYKYENINRNTLYSMLHTQKGKIVDVDDLQSLSEFAFFHILEYKEFCNEILYNCRI